jgi:site-specific DNA-methyltransferase (adenine-specific)
MTLPLRTHRRWEVRQGDCLAVLGRLDTSTIDAVITDPPYGIGIADWDSPRKLDPARSRGRRSRTPQSVAYRRFTEQWGRECLRVLKPGAHVAAFSATRTIHLLSSGLEDAGFEIRDMLLWLHGQGFPASGHLGRGLGTALRPAVEPIVLARKPVEGVLHRNLEKHGTGALNIDACRGGRPSHLSRRPGSASHLGRWPTNVIVSHARGCTALTCREACPVEMLGSHSRLFFCAKPSRRQREAGCERLPRRVTQTFKLSAAEQRAAEANPVANTHPTVKPLDLMRWLTRLLTPPPPPAKRRGGDKRKSANRARPIRRQRNDWRSGRAGGRALPRHRARTRLCPDRQSPNRVLGKVGRRSASMSKRPATMRPESPRGRTRCALPARRSLPTPLRDTVAVSTQSGRGRSSAPRPYTGGLISHARSAYRGTRLQGFWPPVSG